MTQLALLFLMMTGNIPSPILQCNTPQKPRLRYQTLAIQNRAPNCVYTNSLDIGVRKTIEQRCDLARFEVSSEIAKLQIQQSNNLAALRLLEKYNLVEPSPNGRIELALVIRCRDDETLPTKLLNESEKAVYHPAKLAIQRLVIAQPSDGVEFVQ